MVQVVVVAPGMQEPMVTIYVPKLDEFGPVPFNVTFCALCPRFRVTTEACARKGVNSKPPQSASLELLMIAFMNDFLLRDICESLTALWTNVSSNRLLPFEV